MTQAITKAGGRDCLHSDSALWHITPSLMHPCHIPRQSLVASYARNAAPNLVYFRREASFWPDLTPNTKPFRVAGTARLGPHSPVIHPYFIGKPRVLRDTEQPCSWVIAFGLFQPRLMPLQALFSC